MDEGQGDVIHINEENIYVVVLFTPKQEILNIIIETTRNRISFHEKNTQKENYTTEKKLQIK